MEIHKPKPVHGWREFINEIGVIVIGVLIALAAEQAVESWHWRAQAEEARGVLRAELQDDGLPQAYVRLAIEGCLRGQLNGLQGALDGRADRSRFATLARAYRPPTRTWDEQAWQAVAATGALSHGGADELLRWSKPYGMIVVLGPRNVTENADVLDLRSVSSTAGSLTPLERDRTTVALEHLRSDADRMASGSKVLLAEAAQAGIAMTPAQERHVIDELRADWGACLVTPHWRDVDVYTQSERQFTRSANGS